MTLAKIFVALVLSYASLQDLRKKSVHDKVFIIGFLGALMLGIFSNGFSHAGSMLVQGFLAGVVGLIMNFVGRFGGADVWSIALASAVFPGTLLFSVLAGLLVPMVLWVRLYMIFAIRNSEGAPAIPGILIGYLILLSYLGI